MIFVYIYLYEYLILTFTRMTHLTWIKIRIIAITLLLCPRVMGQSWHMGNTFRPDLRGNQFDIFVNSDSAGYQLHFQTDKADEIIRFDSSLNITSRTTGEQIQPNIKSALLRIPHKDKWLQFSIGHTSIAESELLCTYEDSSQILMTQSLCTFPNKYVKANDLHIKRWKDIIVIYFEWARTPRVDNEELTVIEYKIETLSFKKHSIKLDHPNELTTFTNCQLREDSSILFIGKRFEISPKEKRGGHVNFQHCALIYRPYDSLTMLADITRGSSFSSGLRLSIRGDNLLTAFLTSSIKSRLADSLHLCELDLTTGSYRELTSMALDEFHVKKSHWLYNIFRKQYTNLWIDEIVVQGDQITVIMEFFGSRIIGGVGNESIRSYYFGPLILANFTTDGQLRWKQTIDKLQVSENDKAKYSSYRVVLNNKGYLLYYNELERPHRKRNFLGKRRLMSFNSNLVEHTILEDGQEYRKIIHENLGNKEVPMIGRSRITDDDKLVVVMAGKKYFKLATYQIGE